MEKVEKTFARKEQLAFLEDSGGSVDTGLEIPVDVGMHSALAYSICVRDSSQPGGAVIIAFLSK